MKNLLSIGVMLITIASTSLYAKENSHIVGFQVDLGAIDTKDNENTRELNDITSFHYSLSYQYQFNEYFSAGFGYLDGDSESFTTIVDVFTDSELEYSAFMLSARASYPISQRNSLYIQVNALQYDYDIIDDNKTVFSDDGSDFGFGIGWKHQYDMGLGLKVGYDMVNLGSDIKVSSVNAEISYRF